MSNEHVIEKIAKQVRQELELCHKKEKMWTKGLRGACATASFLLKEYLNKEGIKSEVVYAQRKRWGVGHVWLETNDFIIDVTYSQFKASFPIVIVNKKDENHYNSYYKEINSNTIRKNVKQDFFWSWPMNENPEHCLMIVKGII